MYIVDPQKFHKALKIKGFRSMAELARAIGIHRNTIHHYLSGNGVFPSNFEKMIDALDIEPSDLISTRKETQDFPPHEIAVLVDELHLKFPGITFVLFGSRARGAAKKYSDWDLGVFSRKGLTHDLYRRIDRIKDDMVEDLPFTVDLVNLTRADVGFLKEASRGWRFLTGSQQDWIELQRRLRQ